MTSETENGYGRSLKGRRVLITGGSSGLGQAIALTLAQGGARIVTCARSLDHLDPVLEKLRRHDGQARGIAADISKEGDVHRLFSEAEAHLGGLDAVMVNAGVPAGGIAEMAEEDWRYAAETDFIGALACCHAAAERMKGAGGDIVITGSMATHRPHKGSSVYAGAKAGLHAFAESFRKEMGEEGVKVGIIEPGKTASELFEDFSEEDIARFVKEERMLQAEDVAQAARFMLTAPGGCVVSGIRLEPRLHI
ncbi:SDR family oxidoreductase [Parvularcula oceani]|uniref:SDR family oxidoreductase n=1 Tax=Parvularcula oceani TaxID=1247963 RepID=UPI0004E177C1|nr:SDR family oxidoreductase [Parvularcula oceani]